MSPSSSLFLTRPALRSTFCRTDSSRILKNIKINFIIQCKSDNNSLWILRFLRRYLDGLLRSPGATHLCEGTVNLKQNRTRSLMLVIYLLKHASQLHSQRLLPGQVRPVLSISHHTVGTNFPIDKGRYIIHVWIVIIPVETTVSPPIPFYLPPFPSCSPSNEPLTQPQTPPQDFNLSP